MHRSAIIRWSAAALVAVVTSIVVASDLAALHRRASSLGPQRSVVVAARDLALGTTITDSDLTRREIHESQLPPDIALDIDEVRNRVVVVPLLEGTFVSERHLAPPDRDGLAGVVPVGSRAVEVHPVSSPTLEPGDVVDVLAVIDRGGATDAQVASEAALVLRVDDEESSRTNESTTASTNAVTLLVGADDAGLLAEAAAVGIVALALSSPEEAMTSG